MFQIGPVLQAQGVAGGISKGSWELSVGSWGDVVVFPPLVGAPFHPEGPLGLRAGSGQRIRMGGDWKISEHPVLEH